MKGRVRVLFLLLPTCEQNPNPSNVYWRYTEVAWNQTAKLEKQCQTD